MGSLCRPALGEIRDSVWSDQQQHCKENATHCLPPEFVVVRFSFLFSKLYRLFKFDHFAGVRLLVHLQSIYIDSSGDGLPLRVAAIPSQLGVRQRAANHVHTWRSGCPRML